MNSVDKFIMLYKNIEDNKTILMSGKLLKDILNIIGGDDNEK